MNTSCPSCGTENPENAFRCGRCGSELHSGETRTKDGPAPQLVPAAPSGSAGTHPPGGDLVHGALVAGRYRIEEPLGKGGMGEVYRAFDTKVEQRVALKFLPREVSTDAQWMARVRQEVRLARSVAHPNVCRVYDIGDSEWGPFLSMEYVDGEDLASLLRRVGRLAGEKAVDIARQITAGLSAAHSAGVLHRDLKPANVMLDARGQAHVMDFGLAVSHDGDESRREVAGTLAYMAPEQAAAGIASVKSDLFSLGAVLYEIFTGKRPFAARSFAKLVREHREVKPALPSSVAKELDPKLDAVIEQCLSFAPESRPSSAMEVLSALMGGDALGAAVAAGQTPSPQAVAASPVTGILKPAVAWACFAGIALCLGIYLLFGKRLSVIERQAPEYPPEVLAEKSRTILRELGWQGPWKGEDWGFGYNDPAMPLLVRQDPDHPSQRRPAAILFWHRFDLEPVAPPQGSLSVGPQRPPLRPGSSLVILDCQGHLLSLVTVPRSGDPPNQSSGPDWDRATQLAGVDPAQLSPAGPWCCPQVFADTTLSWKSRGSPPNEEVLIRAAALGGRPVAFEVQGPWTGGEPVHLDTSPPQSAGSFKLVELLTLFFGVALAWSNLRQKRGDLSGALKLGAVSAAAWLVGCLLVASHSWSLRAEARTLFEVTGEAMYWGGMVWILYLALEPHVRRLWPESLVSWSRLLAGKWREPIVARDVLIGVLVTGAWPAAILIGLWTGVLDETVGIKRWLPPLLGSRFVMAAFADSLGFAIYFALFNLVFLLLIRTLVRRAKFAAPILFLLMLVVVFLYQEPGISSGALVLAVLVAIAVAGWVLILVRFGLLPVAAGLFLQFLASDFPDATRFSPWYGTITWVSVAAVIVPALYGLVFSVGGERLLRFSMPERD